MWRILAISTVLCLTARSGVGDRVEREVDKLKVANFALDFIEQGTNNFLQRKITEISSYRNVHDLHAFILTLRSTDCIKGEPGIDCNVIEGLPAEECKVVVWADFEHDDQMEVLSKECNALTDAEDEESVEEDSDESDEGEEEDEYESEFVPGLVRINKEKAEDDDEGGDMLGGDDHDYLPHGGGPIGGDDHDYLPHNNGPIGGGDHDYRPHNNLPLGGGEHDYLPHTPELYEDYPTDAEVAYDYEEDSYDYREGEGEEEPSVPTDEHKIKKKILPAEQARLGLVNRAMNKLLKDEKSVASLRNLQSHRSFKKFVKMYNKEYEDMSEYKRRFAIFRENMKKIQFLRETELGTAIYGPTQFSDLEDHEYRAGYLGLNTGLKSKPEFGTEFLLAEPSMMSGEHLGKLPELFDWRSYNAVTPVKNQGMCGSCWAFSVTGNVEGQVALKHHQLLSLSEQELVDCDREDHGCEGGLPMNGYHAIEELGGLETESDYNYEGHEEKCHFDRSKVMAKVVGGKQLPEDEVKLAHWLMKNGPISIGINANSMQFYWGGVAHPWKFLCSPDNLDHGVLIVGFGIHHYPLFKKDMPYWIIKNSWGTGWGEQGYYRIYRGDGSCGVNKMATTAIVE